MSFFENASFHEYTFPLILALRLFDIVDSLNIRMYIIPNHINCAEIVIKFLLLNLFLAVEGQYLLSEFFFCVLISFETWLAEAGALEVSSELLKEEHVEAFLEAAASQSGQVDFARENEVIAGVVKFDRLLLAELDVSVGESAVAHHRVAADLQRHLHEIHVRHHH